MFLVFFAAVVFAAFAAAPAAAESAASPSAKLIDELRERQKDVKTVSARFVQERKTALLRRPLRSEGDFYFKSPVGVRWQYKDGILVIYDGKFLYIYNPELREAEKFAGAGVFIGPLVFDIELLLKDYIVDARTSGGRTILHMKPKKAMPFKSMEMTFGAGSPFPSEVGVVEETGDGTVIGFSDIKVNAALADRLFIFRPPSGVKIKERRIDEN